MKLKSCSSSHFIWTIKDGEVKKVHNTDSQGRPTLKFKKLEDVYRSTNGEYTPVPFAERKTRDYVDEDNEQNFQLNENDLEEITLSQIRKKCKRKKRKASESILLTPKAEFDDDDDPDLSEPLCKLRVRVSKSPRSKSKSKSTHGDGNSPTSSSEDLAIVKVKIEDPEVDYFECIETNDVLDNSLICNWPVKLLASEFGFVIVDHETENTESVSFPNKWEICVFNEVYHNMEDMELDNEENRPIVLLEDDSSLEDSIPSTSGCSESQLYSQQKPEQDSKSTIDDDVYMGEHRILCLPWKSDSWSNPDDHDVDVGPVEVKLKVNTPISEEKQHLTSLKTDADSNSLNSNNNSSVSDHIFVPENGDLEVKFSENGDLEVKFSENGDSEEIRHPERLPVTRKSISPNSQEKLCFAMKSSELLDDTDLYKCKEKLNFEEQIDNKLSSTTSDIKDKVSTSPKKLDKKKNSCKKSSPPKSHHGRRLCRSLPRLSKGCTSIERCSENAVAFSQRQMHDIEYIASKLMSELDSMKAIVEKKLVVEAYRSTSLKNEADKMKSAIKNANKIEKRSKKWLSVMGRDCNRFCKIMKLNSDDNTSPSTAGSPNEKAGQSQSQSQSQSQRKKIMFADEAGGTLCDIKEYQIDRDSQELNEKPQLST